MCGFSQDPYWNLQVLQRERMVCLYFQYVSRVLLFHVPDHDTSLRWNYYRVTAQKKNSTKSCKYKENRGSSICSRSLWSPRKFFKATHWKKKCLSPNQCFPSTRILKNDAKRSKPLLHCRFRQQQPTSNSKIFFPPQQLQVKNNDLGNNLSMPLSRIWDVYSHGRQKFIAPALVLILVFTEPGGDHLMASRFESSWDQSLWGYQILYMG